MSKRVQLTDEELYVIRQALQDLRNNSPSAYWAYRYAGNLFLDALLLKLEPAPVTGKDHA